MTAAEMVEGVAGSCSLVAELGIVVWRRCLASGLLGSHNWIAVVVEVVAAGRIASKLVLTHRSGRDLVLWFEM